MEDWLPVVVVVTAVWLISAALHPYTACPRCSGKGRHHSWLRPWAWRDCHWCSGKGRRRSLGAVILRRGDRRVASSRWAPRTGKK